ncbi:hypothetical protein KI387_015168, partial [Taxus chinensis]
MVKSYGRYGYEYDDDDDMGFADFDSDGGYAGDDLLPEELNNLNSEDVKSAEKTSVTRLARTHTGLACPERELKQGKGKTNVLSMNKTRLPMKGTSRADSSALQPSSLSLSREEWEKRAIEIIQQQKLRRIAMEKKKAEQKIMLKASKSEGVSPPMRSIATKKKNSKQKTMLKSAKSEGVSPPMGSIATEKKNSKQKTMLKSVKSKDVDPRTESIAMERKKAKHKVMLKSSKSEDVGPLIKNIAMKKKKTNQKIMLKSTKAEDVDILTGRSIIICSTSAISNEEVKAEKDIKYHQMRKRLGCEARCEPLIQYLSNLGFKEAHLVRIYDRRRLALHIKVEAVQKRLDFFVGMGVKSEDLVKIITRQPKILEYTIDGKIKPHIEFLLGLGVPASRLGRILSAAPSLLSYSVELSLKPKVKFLTEEVGIDRKKLGKVVVLSPQILIQRVEDSMKSRLDFLSEELGASKESLVKMVTKHPQLLRYSIEDGIKPRIEFLRSIGMSKADIVKVLTSLTQASYQFFDCLPDFFGG